MFSKDIAFTIISDLVTRFDEQLASYKKAEYNETQVRRDFIDPFFRALGWDVDNSQGYAEAYREVIHEDRVKVSGATKAPDYSFRLPGGKRLFFVEAKKPSVAVKTDTLPAYQVRRYAWSAKLPISLLTDFEEFAVYDCNKKPSETDKASTGRINYLTYKDYLNEFDFLWDTFSKERVLKGSFDKYIASDAGKKGTTTVDKEFLASLDEWRILLAQNIALRNTAFTEDDLNFAVQQTIDRIIFLRIAEDRGVEEYGLLKKCVSGVSSGNEGLYYQNLFTYFKEADSKYNSGLFDFKKDKLSATLQVDNKVLKAIIGQLYYPVSPYEFSVLSVEILGSAYEQFLGKQIKLDARHKVVIDEKPEVRKAGGVYYTPQYIVDYIVEKTVGASLNPRPADSSGRLAKGGTLNSLQGHDAEVLRAATPQDVAKLKIVDPACGSGSFLIGAYDYLMKWHLNYYKPTFIELSEIAGNSALSNEVRRKAQTERAKLPLTPDGNLNSAIKKQILLNNIYGVDIDTQAVEVTKLSLLLKCMEGETSSSINAEMRFGERILPTLDSNIKSGNSLVDLDYYDGEIDYEPGADKKVKPFSWQQAFPAVFKQGGFDAVIGNPPYDVLEKDRLGESAPHEALHKYSQLSTHYKQALGGKLNLYRFFIIKSIQLTKVGGRFGLIVPSSILGDKSCSNTREFLLSSTKGLEFDCFPQKDNPSKRIFEDAKLSTTIFFGEKIDLKRNYKQTFTIRTYPGNSFQDPYKHCLINIEDLKLIDPNNIPIPLIDNRNWEALKKVHTTKGIKNLGQVSDYVIRRGEINQTVYRNFIEVSPKGNEPLIKGVQIGPYRFNNKISQGKVEWFNEKKSLVKQGLKDLANQKRIATQRITGVDERLRLVACPIGPKAYFADSTNSIHLSENANYDLQYLLALLNSKLYQWRFKLTSTNNNVGTNELEAMPFKEVDFNNKKENGIYNELIKGVAVMLSLNEEIQIQQLDSDRSSLQQRIQYTNEKINRLVYELYELTEEEIKMVEGQ
jgi:Alw26I/Eco31I/Esp3I family type II restriction m6 adenine DNA methyltransferase